MLQRLQSIFLLLALISMAALFSDSLPFVSVFGDESNLLNTSQTILDDGVFDISDHILLIALVCISVLLSFVSIFLFKNRPLQIKLSRINLVLTALLFILSIFLFYQAYDSLAQGAEVSIEYGYVNPFLTILFLVLAIRYIARDEKLVRSSDRLR